MTPLTYHEVEEELVAAFRSNDWDAVAVLAPQLDRLQPVPADATLAGAALWYAEQGHPVFPLQPGGKVPYPGSRGVHDATTDPDAVHAWWRIAPTSNIGLATGHRVDVIDFDGPEAHVAWSTRYAGGWAGVSTLGTVSTPRPGGIHVYVPRSGAGNRAGMLPGVDYRGKGGYVVAPPSRTDLGSYRWLRPLNLGRPA